MGKIALGFAAALSAFIGFSSVGYCAEQIDSIKAPFHVNETLMVCGQVAEVTSQAKRMLLNLGNSYPKEHVSVLIWKSDLQPFTEKFGNLSSLKNQRVCSQGKIHQYKDHLFITVKNPSLLRLMK